MNLENRYFVVKRSDLNLGAIIEMAPANASMRHLAEIAETNRSDRGALPLQCLVIEKDWPEYPVVLKMLADRVDAAKETR
jgi:hypothetical protein